MDKDLDGKLYAAVLHTITVLHFERLNSEQRAYLAGAIVREIALRGVFVHVTPECDHEFKGWRDFEDGSGGEQVCSKCGTGAMSNSLRNGL